MIHFVTSAFVAPFLLLRTEQSVKLSWSWYEKVFFPGNRDSVRPPLANSSSERLIAPVIVPLYLWGCSAFEASELLVIRAGAAALTLLTSPLESINAMPRNWTRAIFCVDSCYPLEMLPEAYERFGKRSNEGIIDGITEITTLPLRGIRLQLKDLRGATERIVAYITVPVLCVLFLLPALLYRWYLKGSFVVYLPFMFIFYGSRTDGSRTLDPFVHLGNILNR